MNVLILAKNDWANLGYMIKECLNNVNVDAYMLVRKKHKFNYPEHGIYFKDDSQVKEYAEKADVILFMHSQYIETGISLKDKKVFVWHTGSRFRQHSKSVNSVFNPIVNASICGRDVFGYGAKNEKWIGGPVDTDKLIPNYNRVNKKRIVLAHYPSGKKGIDSINNSINNVKSSNLKDKFIFNYNGERVSWEKQLERVSGCDVYIEDMSIKQKNEIVSVFGIAALEAAALGKIVVTRFLFFNEYEKMFGKCGLHVTNTSKELILKIRNLVTMSDEELIKQKKLAREWVVRCHSYEAVGKRLLKLFKGDF